MAERVPLSAGDGRAPARLVADEDRAAETDDFFRSRAFYNAEGVSHSLLVEGAGDGIALPLLVHEVGDSGRRDAITPYGYPGGAILSDRGSPLDPEAVDWSATDLVSMFVRDRIGREPLFRNATRRSAVQVHDPARERRIPSPFAEQNRHNQRPG